MNGSDAVFSICRSAPGSTVSGGKNNTALSLSLNIRCSALESSRDFACAMLIFEVAASLRASQIVPLFSVLFADIADVAALIEQACKALRAQEGRRLDWRLHRRVMMNGAGLQLRRSRKHVGRLLKLLMEMDANARGERANRARMFAHACHLGEQNLGQSWLDEHAVG